MSNQNFNKEAWFKLDVFNQMGNIGSEVGRALSAKRQGKSDWMHGAFYRGLDLIDATAEQWAAQKRPGLKELLYARELFVRSVVTNRVDKGLENYFMQFAMAARLHR